MSSVLHNLTLPIVLVPLLLHTRSDSWFYMTTTILRTMAMNLNETVFIQQLTTNEMCFCVCLLKAL